MMFSVNLTCDNIPFMTNLLFRLMVINTSAFRFIASYHDMIIPTAFMLYVVAGGFDAIVG